MIKIVVLEDNKTQFELITKICNEVGIKDLAVFPKNEKDRVTLLIYISQWFRKIPYRRRSAIFV